MQSAALIYNPAAGAHRRLDRASESVELCRRLEAKGIAVEPLPTTGPGSATEAARTAVRSGVDFVIAAGGDGTLNEVIQGMAESETPLAIWPTGTANVLALELGVPRTIDSVVSRLERGTLRRISLGKAGGRYFALMAGIGLDASIIRSVRPELKARFGEKAFWLSGLTHCLGRNPEPFTIEVDGKTFESGFAAIGNGSKYGGSLSITPNARLDEPSLDICIFPPRRFGIEYTPSLIACMTGDPKRFGEVTYLKTQSVRASIGDGEKPWVQIDGELFGQIPMNFACVPNALTVLVH